jgi:hypothetical protein
MKQHLFIKNYKYVKTVKCYSFWQESGCGMCASSNYT